MRKAKQNRTRRHAEEAATHEPQPGFSDHSVNAKKAKMVTPAKNAGEPHECARPDGEKHKPFEVPATAELHEWLQQNMLSEYESKMRDVGIELMEDLLEIEEQDLFEFGMKKYHVKRLMRKVKGLAAENAASPAPPSPASTAAVKREEEEEEEDYIEILTDEEEQEENAAVAAGVSPDTGTRNLNSFVPAQRSDAVRPAPASPRATATRHDFSEVSDDILSAILRHLDPSDVVSVSLCNRAWRRAAERSFEARCREKNWRLPLRPRGKYAITSTPWKLLYRNNSCMRCVNSSGEFGVYRGGAIDGVRVFWLCKRCVSELEVVTRLQKWGLGVDFQGVTGKFLPGGSQAWQWIRES